MRFLHTGDWHITAGKAFIPNAVHRTFQAIHEIYKLASLRNIDVVVVAGDIFDSPDLTQEEKNQLADVILHYDDQGFTTLMIPGNHDKTSDHHTTLSYLALLTKHGVYHNSRVVEKTELAVVGTTGFLLFTGEPWGLVDVHIQSIMEGSCDLGLTDLVVVAHLTHKGAITDGGFKLKDGDIIHPNQHVTYYALGDIHGMQRVSPRAFYSGSPLQINFGEVPPNGVLIVDTDNPDNPEFVEIDNVSNLLTVTSPHETVPDNSFVRLKYEEDAQVDDTSELPPQFIKVVRPPVTVDLSAIKTGDGMFDGLEEIMAQRGLSLEEIKMAKSELKKATLTTAKKLV